MQPPPPQSFLTQMQELSSADWVNSDDLLDFAGDAEQVRLRLAACQNFVEREGKLNDAGN
jgi:hypothetical protein